MKYLPLLAVLAIFSSSGKAFAHHSRVFDKVCLEESLAKNFGGTPSANSDPDKEYDIGLDDNDGIQKLVGVIAADFTEFARNGSRCYRFDTERAVNRIGYNNSCAPNKNWNWFNPYGPYDPKTTKVTVRCLLDAIHVDER